MADRAIGREISKNVSELWWLWVLQAIISILFGIVATFWPALTLVTLVYLIAPFVVAIGLIEVIRSLMTVNYRDTWWMSLIIGFLTLGVGVYLAHRPHVSFESFVLLIGITFIAWGVIDIAKAFLDHIFTAHRTYSFISGLAGIIAGIIVLLQPVAGGVAFVWVLGLFSLVYGTLALAMSIDHHRDYRELKSVLSDK
jgi:uncharacterized membrane protein HdeD (DUF308 family)